MFGWPSRSQGRFKKAQIRCGDGLVLGGWGENRKTRGRGRPRPFLESDLRSSFSGRAKLAIQLEPARLGTIPIVIQTMLDIKNPLFWLLGVVVVVAIRSLVRSNFSTEAREQRRRERSHQPVVSRRHGPTIRLAVDVGKPRRVRKG